MDALEQLSALHSLRRTGWVKRGMENAETVGQHTAECEMKAALVAEVVGVNRAKLVDMLKVHDWAESDPKVGDISPHCGVSRDEKHARELAAMRDLCGRLENGDRILALWLEFEEGVTPEAVVAKQIDKLQMADRAVRYMFEQGLDPAEFLADADRNVSHPVLRAELERLKKVAFAGP
jgi:putative hydrolase of HD superfamily